ncbi:hypothetical protein [Iningainema tapete]|uniref:hypothetical protein n=1 Tax=Iningainema tapete TaxID=2806730 RepID=UPI0030DA7050
MSNSVVDEQLLLEVPISTTNLKIHTICIAGESLPLVMNLLLYKKTVSQLVKHQKISLEESRKRRIFCQPAAVVDDVKPGMLEYQMLFICLSFVYSLLKSQ